MNIEKEKRAIEYLQSFEPPEGYYLAYSGGKVITWAELPEAYKESEEKENER